MVAGLLVKFAVILSLSSHASAWRHFWKGKWRNVDDNGVLVGVPPDQWFEQKLNHFDVVDTRTWSQRYHTNETFFKGDGPVFLMIGGEGEAQPKWMVQGMWIEWAKKFGALCFQLEHRYYGKSHPTKDMSTKNLKFLSSGQALADLATFIEYKKKEYKLDNNKWIVFGGSYPGSLAAWFRLKYPHLAFGAVASSAPLFAKINFKEYLGVVTNSLETSSQGALCTDAIKGAVAELEEQLQIPTCCKKIEKAFQLCDKLDPDNDLDVANLFESLAGNFEGVVQYNKDNRDSSKSANITVDVVCDVMTSSNFGSPMDRYAAVNSILLNSVGEKCLDYKYEKFLKDMRSVSWNSSASEGGRQWTYQTCTEFGYYQSSDLSDQPFGTRFPVDFSIRQCSDIFGNKFNIDLLENAVERTNTEYGALGIQSGTRVVFPNGSIDPWSALGITDNSTGNVAVFIQGTAHCADMYPPSVKDSAELKAARDVIESYLVSWL